MHFFNPLNLIWALPMAGLIILMYILKLRRRDVIVSSTFLWRQVIRDVQANAPFQKLRKNLLLFLQLLAVALLVFALSRPFFRTTGMGGRSVVILVDTSASMAAVEDGRSRMDEAKRAARQVIDSMRPSDQMIVLSAASRPNSETGFTTDRSELRRAIDGLTPKATGTNMRDAVNLAAALVATRQAAQIDLISDGAFAPITNVNLDRTRVNFHPIGKAGHNVAIAAVDYRHSLTGERKVQVFATVHNFDTVPRSFNVELYHRAADKSNTLLDAHELSLPAGGESPDVFDLPEPSNPVTLQIKIDAKDDLAVDNEASLVIEPRRIVRVLLLTEENLFLQTALASDPNIDLGVAKPGANTAGYDVIVFDGSAPSKLPDGNYFFVNCANGQSPASIGAETPNQGLIDTNKNHPVLRYVELADLRWSAMRSGRPAGWAQEIASSESGSAIVAGEKGRMRALWTGFDLDRGHSIFPERVAYPIFLSNAVRWLAHVDDTESQTRTGTAVAVGAPGAGGKLTVTRPDGSKRDLVIPASGQGVFDETDQAGLYTVTGPAGYKRIFAANLADYAESDIQPRKSPDLGGNPPGQIARQVTVTRELWLAAAAVLLALLAFEWYAFHRRVYVSG